MAGELRFHGCAVHPPQHGKLMPAPEFLTWNVETVFKAPARHAVAATVTRPQAR